MITVDGSGGKGELWVIWKPGISNTAIPVPTTITSYCPNRVDIIPVIPCSMYLPPVTGPNVMYDTRFTPYGGRILQLPIGEIYSIEGDKKIPNPCTQSTISGTCILLANGTSSFPRYRVEANADPYAGPYYRDGSRVSFMSGKCVSFSTKKAYNHRGEDIVITTDSNNSDLWYANFSLYDSCIPVSETSPLRPYGRIVHGDYAWNPRLPTEGMTSAARSTKHTWRHISANVWEEEWWQSYHSSASYTPKEPYAPSGYGYVIAAIRRRKIHTLNFVHQVTPGYFRGQFSVVEELDYWGHTPSYPVAKYFSSDGIKTGTYSYTATLQVLYPGLTQKIEIDTLALDNYCLSAIERARLFYKEKSMGIARSNALADVQALDSNWIENLAQVKGTLNVIKPLLDGYLAVKNGDLSAGRRAIGGAFLAYQYSIAPSIRDYKDVKGNIKPIVRNVTKYRFSNERRRGGFFESAPVLDTTAILSYHCIYHLQLKDNSFAVIWNALEKLGLDPSASNFWDLIPFSFVADWFFKIGPALTKMDQYSSAVLIQNVKYRIQSFKVQWPITESACVGLLPPSLQACGELTYSWYDRRIANRIGIVDPFAGQSISGLSVSQSAQAGALLSNFIR